MSLHALKLCPSPSPRLRELLSIMSNHLSEPTFGNVLGLVKKNALRPKQISTEALLNSANYMIRAGTVYDV